MRSLLTLWIFYLSGYIHAQNLVSNPFFNDSSGFSPGVSILNYVDYFTGWTHNSALDGTINIPRGGFSLIGSSNIHLPGVGHNPMPFFGTGYMAMYTCSYNSFLYSGNQCNISIHRNSLTEPLLADTTYCVESMVRAWNGKISTLYVCNAHDKLGFYFTDQVRLPTAEPWNDNIVPQIWNNTGYINNLDNWRPIRSSFVADGGEQYMFIGNFDPFNGPLVSLSDTFSPCDYGGYGITLMDAVMVYNCNDTVFNITLKDTTVCHGQQVTLLPAVGGFKLDDTVTTYNWYTPLGTFLAADTFFVATQPGKYTLEVVINKRFKAMQSIEVKWMAPKPDTLFLPDTVLLCRDKTISLFAPYIDSAQYTWSNGDTDTLTHISWPGQYTLNITHPCWQHTETVEAMPVNCQEIYIPNAFTPDGNGTNDFFEIRGLHEYNGLPITLYITDRWGKVVYSSSNYKNTWDGTYNGQPLEAAVYTYRVIYNKVAGGINYEKYGSVTIIR